MMKKNFLFLLAMVILAMANFTSCSSTDDENNVDEGDAITKVGKAELFINGTKVDILTEGKDLLYSQRFGGESMTLGSTIWFKEESGREGIFRFYFSDIDNVKVGDELTEKSNYWYEIQYESAYSFTGGEYVRDEMKDCIGSVKVSKLNKSEKTIRLDIKDIKVALNDKNGFPSINGERISISGYIERSMK